MESAHTRFDYKILQVTSHQPSTFKDFTTTNSWTPLQKEKTQTRIQIISQNLPKFTQWLYRTSFSMTLLND